MPDELDGDRLRWFVQGDLGAFEALFKQFESGCGSWRITCREDLMRPHPYLRAYMAGIVVPTLFLLVVMVVFASHRYYFEVPNQFVLPLPGSPLERTFIFPMAIVPNVWGLWNILHVALRSRLRLSLAVHGALLPLPLMPGGLH